MLRTALKPRWLGLLAFVIVVMVTFGTLGLWQLNVARDRGRAEAVKAAPHLPVAALTAVLAPNQPFPDDGSGRRITATGRYDASGQVLVVPRRLHGRTGSWVVTPLVVTQTGARLAVVRGFVEDAASAEGPSGAPVAGEPADTTVSGTLAPGESPAEKGTALGPGRLGSLDLSVLANQWPGQIYNAFVFATGEEPDRTTVASSAIVRIPPPAIGESGLSWRNAAYALQWWIFALFAAYMWWRMVRDEHQDEQDARAGRLERVERVERIERVEPASTRSRQSQVARHPQVEGEPTNV